jgi:hypothetical protein
MSLKKSLLGILTGSILLLGLTGCEDNIDGTYMCKDNGNSLEIKLDGKTFDLYNSENKEWFSKSSSLKTGKKNNSTMSSELSLSQDENTKIYYANVDMKIDGKVVKKETVLTFSILKDDNLKLLRLGNKHLSLRNVICYKSKK